MAVWDGLLSGHDEQVYNKAGYARRVGFGEKPALVIIDVTYSFAGDRPEPVLESIKRFPQSCGEVAWKAIHQISRLLPIAREKKIPIIYADRKPSQRSLLRKWDNLEYSTPDLYYAEHGHSIVQEIAPANDDVIIFKECPSIFFGTPLMSILSPLGIDTLLICGCTTSGCIRASVVDAASYGFRVAVIEECTFDRVEISHKLNLFEMDCKYADVVSVAEVKDYLSE